MSGLLVSFVVTVCFGVFWWCNSLSLIISFVFPCPYDVIHLPCLRSRFHITLICHTPSPRFIISWYTQQLSVLWQAQISPFTFSLSSFTWFSSLCLTPNPCPQFSIYLTLFWFSYKHPVIVQYTIGHLLVLSPAHQYPWFSAIDGCLCCLPLFP